MDTQDSEYGDGVREGPELRYKRKGEADAGNGIKLETFQVEVLGGTVLEFDSESTQGKLGCKGVYIAGLDGGASVRKYFLWKGNTVTVEEQAIRTAEGASIEVDNHPKTLAGSEQSPIMRIGYTVESAQSTTGSGPNDNTLIFTEIRPKQFTLPPAPKVLA